MKNIKKNPKYFISKNKKFKIINNNGEYFAYVFSKKYNQYIWVEKCCKTLKECKKPIFELLNCNNF